MRKLDISKAQTLIDLAVEEDYAQGDPTTDLTSEKLSKMRGVIGSISAPRLNMLRSSLKKGLMRWLLSAERERATSMKNKILP